MRTHRFAALVLAFVVFVGVAGTKTVAQEPPFVLHRVCDIEPGQNVPAAAQAREITNYLNQKHPNIGTRTFATVLFPINQLHWTSEFADLATFQSVRLALLTDAGYQGFVQKAVGILDGSSCTDTLHQELP